MFDDRNTDHQEILGKMETNTDFYEKVWLAQASQIECSWEEVKG